MADLPAADPTHEDQPESPGCDEPDSSHQADPGPSTPIVVDCINHTDTPQPVPADWIQSHLTRAAELVGLASAHLAVVIVNDPEMAQLHEQYTGVAGTTDVLTFDLAEGETGPNPLAIEGDIIICLDEAKRQAQQRNHPPHHELLLYAVHGLLHLIGEDDHNEADYQRMHAREDELLNQLGIGRVFNPDP